jgi:spore germination protein YaaH
MDCSQHGRYRVRRGGIARPKLARRLAAVLAAWVSVAAPAGAGWAAGPQLIGFHAPWDPRSLASLQLHGGDLDAIVPAWVSVTGPGHALTVVPDPAGRAAAALARRPRLWLMVQNALLGAWDGPGAAALFHDKTATAALLRELETQTVASKADGLVFDVEDLPPGAQPDLLAFLAAAHDLCRRHGWILAITAPAANPDWNLAALGQATDRLILMAYDEHWQTGPPGPIASDPWFETVVRRALAQIPSGRAIVGIAAYAYDWPARGPAAILSIPDAEALAARSGARPERDQAGGGEHFSYVAGDGAHVVWMSDAVAAARQMALARAAGAQAIAIWRLGTEDPRLWAETSTGQGDQPRPSP